MFLKYEESWMLMMIDISDRQKLERIKSLGGDQKVAQKINWKPWKASDQEAENNTQMKMNTTTINMDRD